MKSRTLILMWSNEGLESIIDATEADKKMMWSTLKEEVHIDVFRLNAMVLRARFNSHRECEIYAIDVDYGITVEKVKEMFLLNLTDSIKLIKEKGRNLFSDNKEHIT